MNEALGSKKIIIAHRGASGYLPEHTLAAKAMAYAMGPHFLEQDVVLTSDDVAIVIHDIHLDNTTNVAEVFPDRARADGLYYAIDFTYKELLKLSVHERVNASTGTAVYPNRFPLGKSYFQIHTLAQEIELIQGLNHSTGKEIGIYVELKEPSFHRKEGKDLAQIVLNLLSKYGYTKRSDACVLQCFDATELKRIRKDLESELFLVQLFEDPKEIANIPKFATFADGIGPWIGLLNDGQCMKLARSHHLKVHAFTLRKEELFESSSFEAMLKQILFQHNVDGVFTDQPDAVISFLKNN